MVAADIISHFAGVRSLSCLVFFLVLVVRLDAVLLLELDVLLVEGVDAVDHALHQLHLGVAQAVLVRDVVRVACDIR